MAEPEAVPQWGRTEGSLVHPDPPAVPYRDATLLVSCVGPSGSQVNFSGFYDGGATWSWRFMPDALGSWRYEAHFADDAARTNGSFEVAPSAIPGPICRDLSNPMWFGHRSGEHLLLRALHVGDRFFAANWRVEKRTIFLDWLQEQGYNALSIASHLLNRDVEGRGVGWETPRLWPLEASEYLKMEAILTELADRGLVVFPFAGFIGRDSRYPDDTEEQRLYINYSVARMGSYWNLLFNVAGPEPNLRHWLSPEDVERVACTIAECDPYGHLLSVHNRTGDDLYRDSSWSTFGTLQGPKTLDRKLLGERLLANHHPDKPLLAQETLWSGNKNHIRACDGDYGDDDLRKNAFVINMCAAALCFADNDGLSSSGFSGSMELADRRQERHDIIADVWDFFETIPFYQMSPRPELVDSGFCLADADSEHILIYLDGPGEVNVELGPGAYDAEWIDARDTSRRTRLAIASGRGLHSPDGWDDALLRLVRTT